MRVDVDYSDLTTLAKRLTDQPELRKEIVPHFKQMSVDYFSLAFADAPNKTGRLANSIIQTFPTPLTSVTGSDGSVKYFPMVYLGTRPHKISASPRSVVKTRVSKLGKVFTQTYHGSLKFSPSGSADAIFRKGVMHPGTRPNPFLFRTWLYNAKSLVQKLESEMVDVINKETKV